MKFTQTFLLLLLFAIGGLQAQVPAGINFQGTARDNTGTLLSNESLTVRIDVVDVNSGNVDYTESHDLTTDAIGLYSFVIGTGTIEFGDFDAIDWSVTRNMDLEMDIGSDNTIDIEFTAPLNAVPYALYAKDVENKDDADADPSNELQQLTISGNEIRLSDGGTVTLPADAVNDADADPSNEIQQLSLSGKDLTLSNGGTVTLPADEVNDADADPANEIQQISINGNEVNLSDGGSFTLPADEVNDADADATNELQELSISGNELTLSNGNTVSIPTGGTDADADPTNEIQQISINGNEISLSDGGSISLPADEVNDADADATNEIQQISINGRTVSLSSGGTVVLPADEVNDADADATNEIQELELTNDQLTISGGNAVDLSKYNVAYGDEEADVPTIPTNGQLYFDEICNSLYIYHVEGWTEVPLGATIINIYDKDGDGTPNATDNCPETFNPMQEDADMDGIGDVCDDDTTATDTDNDGIADDDDNCPDDSNADQADADGDGIGDVCDDDGDNDGVADATDNCPNDSNADQADSDSDGVGNVCDNCPDDSNADQTDADGDGVGDVCDTGLHPAFSEFDSDNYTIYLDGNQVVIETNGLPNHTSPYWSNTTERCLGGRCTNSDTSVDHPLFTAPTATSFEQMAPGNIDDFNGSYTLRVPVSPTLAATSTATGLGAIGMAVSGSVIYNDEEGPNVPLDNAVGSLDYTAAHTGPQSYHYHLEPKAWSDDDDKLIGIIADGFFLYGRRDYDGSYPTDLDDSGGHFGPTPHNPSGEYHYHIQNELYLNAYYILFPDDYKGTPGTIQ